MASTEPPVRVLLVEDSPLWIHTLRQAVEAGGDCRVVGTAEDGEAAVARNAVLRPDVVLLDLHLPILDGLDCITRIMSEHPTPILAVTSDPDRRLIFHALERGALELYPKPERHPPGDDFSTGLTRRLKVLSGVPVVRHMARRHGALKPSAPVELRPASPVRAVGIVASTGGPPALARLLETLPTPFPPVLIVQHLASGFVHTLAHWLHRRTAVAVRVARSGELITRGVVYLADDGAHLRVSSSGRLRVSDEPPVLGHRPSGNVLLESLAESFGPGAAGVVLTGMGDDGTLGLQAIRHVGGSTFAQDEGTAAVYGMPRAAAESGAAQTILPLDELGPAIAGTRRRR